MWFCETNLTVNIQMKADEQCLPLALFIMPYNQIIFTFDYNDEISEQYFTGNNMICNVKVNIV